MKDADKKLSGEDCREGLTAVISVKLTEAQFEGQTKGKLGNTEMTGLVSKMVYDKMMTYFEENPTVAKAIFNKALTLRAPEKPREKRGTAPEENPRSRATPCPANWRTAPTATPKIPKFISSRAIPPAAPPKRGATAIFRRFCRFGAKCSTSKKPASTKLSATTN